MILDNLLAFDPIATPNNFAGVVAGTTVVSQNVLDLHISGIPVLANLPGARDIGIGDDPALKLLVQVSTVFTSGGAATLTISLQGATDNGSGAPNAFCTWWSSPAYTLAHDRRARRTPLRHGHASPTRRHRHPTLPAHGLRHGRRHLHRRSARRLHRPRPSRPIYQSTGNAVLGGYPAGVTVAN